MEFVINEENRITLNLSLYAFNILNDDLLIFFDENKQTKSTIINKIFINYYLDARASIKSYGDALSQKFSEILNETLDKNKQYSVIQCLVDHKKKESMDEINSYPKGKSLNIKFNKHAREKILKSEEADNYKGCLSHYIKAIVEEYARLPFYQREKIIYKDKFKLIEEAINDKKQVKITVASNKNFDIIPYKITTDKLYMFNYIVGYYPDNESVVSYRISRAEITPLRKGGVIKGKKKEMIEDKISKYDIPFLTSQESDETICVELDKRGISKYNTQLHMRPMYDKKEGNKYYFSTSENQILFYFLKFGNSAKVLEPKSLADEFKAFYKSALKNYNNQ